MSSLRAWKLLIIIRYDNNHCTKQEQECGNRAYGRPRKALGRMTDLKERGMKLGKGEKGILGRRAVQRTELI